MFAKQVSVDLSEKAKKLREMRKFRKQVSVHSALVFIHLVI